MLQYDVSFPGFVIEILKCFLSEEAVEIGLTYKNPFYQTPHPNNNVFAINHKHLGVILGQSRINK